VDTDLGVQMVPATTATPARVRLTLQGPSDRWFAFAFDATRMADKPYTLVVERVGGGADGFGVSERNLGACGDEAGHCVSGPIPAKAALINMTVDAATGRRTVVLERDALVVWNIK
jgi:hypothetical protein